MRRCLPWRRLVCGGTCLLRDNGNATSSSASSSSSGSGSFKQTVAEKLEAESQALGRVACYPHRCMTRPVLPVPATQMLTPLFTSKVMELNQLATDLHCVSFSAPKAHWDAAVVLIKGNPDEVQYEVWVNPSVPGYDDRHSVAPMYGMWENCISCGAATAWVIRPQRITCTGFDEHGRAKTQVLDGMRARCLMHEMDHLMGKTILHQTTGPEFVVSTVAMSQRQLWPANFPSAEAYITAPGQFFDYVQNTTVIPPGLEWWYAQSMRDEFGNERIGQ
ncbi:polypeptide deformylase-like protein [Novymonas esmeraldas]|uniref:Peptide deformylase n=1 Tax=Novymonas esmeraldas TaxID=1808958 RepID=A0AAW0F2U3_9TRYP